MELEWEKSSAFPNTYYCNPENGASPGNLELKRGEWIWTAYDREIREHQLGNNLEEAKAVVEAMIRLEG
jgi:hypothetical protein